MIIFEQIPDLVLGVSDPVILLAYSDLGEAVNYVVTSGANRVAVNDSKLVPVAIGDVTIKAVGSQTGEEALVTFSITDGGYYDRLAAIQKLNNQIANDSVDLTNISKIGVGNIHQLTINIFSHSAEVIINGTTYTIDSLNSALIFLDQARSTWTTEIAEETARLDGWINELKTINP